MAERKFNSRLNHSELLNLRRFFFLIFNDFPSFFSFIPVPSFLPEMFLTRGRNDKSNNFLLSNHPIHTHVRWTSTMFFIDACRPFLTRGERQRQQQHKEGYWWFPGARRFGEVEVEEKNFSDRKLIENSILVFLSHGTEHSCVSLLSLRLPPIIPSRPHTPTCKAFAVVAHPTNWIH